MQPNVYLKDVVARFLADRGLPGSVAIYPGVPLAKRLETGERAQFVVEYRGSGSAHLLVDEYEIACGTQGAPVARALADKIERARRAELAA